MEPTYVYMGTYTTENKKNNRNACGKGIGVYRIDPETSKWDLIQEEACLNPAVLAFGKDKASIYCVNTGSGYVSAYRRDRETGKISILNQAMTDGNNVMILSVDPAGEWLAAGDHKGIITIFSLEADGKIGEKTDSFQLPGEKGPLNEKIQPWSRPHHLPFSPDGNYMFAADKGLDIVHIYRLDRATGKMSLVQQLPCHGASCPRHIAFHPNQKWVYFNTEYTSTIVCSSYDSKEGHITPFQVVSALPDDYYDIKNMTSELAVHPNGKSIYISNRRHNSLGAFSINKDDGRIAPIGWVSAGGVKPRFFAIEPSGKYLFSGNQMSNTLVVFEIAEDGMLKETGKSLEIPCPVWILFTGPVERLWE